MGHPINDLTGRQFGRWRVVSYAGSDQYSKATWLCHCICGVERVVRKGLLLRGESQSCGCLNKEIIDKLKFKHGFAVRGQRYPEYSVWAAMVQRCINPNHPAFQHYGARGITVCKRWLQFKNFITDMGQRPSKLYSLERVNNNESYCIGNCRWATKTEQQRNRRDVRLIAFKGQNCCLAEWAVKLRVPYTTLFNRLKRGWPVERAFVGSA